MKADKYEVLKKSRYRKQLKEKNDCTVIASAITFRMPYKKAHEMCRIAGRTIGDGFYSKHIFALMRIRGFKITPVKNLKQKNGSRYTPKTIGKRLKRGYYMVHVNGHVLAVVNGVVHDWSKGRQHHITSAHKITRTRT